MSDERFRVLFENSLDAMVIADNQGQYLDVNQAACELFGYSRERMLSMRVGDLTTRQSLGAAEQYQAYLESGQEAGEFTFFRADGVSRTAYYSACNLAPDQHLSILRDITESKSAEQALQQSEARFRSLIENALDIITIMNPDGTIRYESPAVALVLGYAADDLVGKLAFEFVHPDDLSMMIAVFSRLLQHPHSSESAEYRFRHKDGSWRILESRGRNALDNPAVSGIIINSRDITERVEHLREIEALNARLQRSIKETHHRVKNNLQIISSLVEVQIEEAQEYVPVAAMTRISQHTRALAAIHDILTQQAKNDTDTNFISMRIALDKLIPLLRATTGGRQIQYHVEDINLPVSAGASLALLISETISNAVKHGNGDIELSLTVQGNAIRLEVSDDGPGFPPGFNWQTSTNTGLILIDSMGRHDLRGTISYENRPEGGARVVVIFPIPLLS